MKVLTVDVFKKQWRLGKKWGILQVFKKRKERKKKGIPPLSSKQFNSIFNTPFFLLVAASNE